MNEYDINYWCEEISKLGILYNLTLVSSPNSIVKGFEGETESEGKVLKLRVLLPISFPLDLPDIYLVNKDEVGRLPHIDSKNQVCFQEQEGIIFDRKRPVSLIVWSINRAVNEINKGLRSENTLDFTEEFEVYWSELKGRNIINLFNPSSNSRETYLFTNNKDNISVIAEKEADILAFFKIKKIWEKTTIQKITYLVFPARTKIIPPLVDSFWDSKDLKKVAVPALNLLSDKNKRHLLKRNKSKKGLILFSIPRSSSGYSLFGVEYQNSNGKHPLIYEEGETVLKPVTLNHLEKSYIVPRGGGNNNMAKKSILLVGCGSVGGHIAHEIVRAGILNLTLIDQDAFKIENTFRHVLGMSKWNKKKATGLKEDLSSKYPYLNCESFDEPLEEVVSKLKLSNYDLVIVAIGSPTIELWFNEYLTEQSINLPVVFTWLEPLGIGGHALLVKPHAKGCFECLYSSDEEDLYLFNRASFSLPGQNFSVSLTGCNNLFTQYGSLDASRTANLATKVALDFLLEKETQSALFSWKGDSELFVSNGFKLSNRFNLNESKLKETRHQFVKANCPVCSKIKFID